MHTGIIIDIIMGTCTGLSLRHNLQLLVSSIALELRPLRCSHPGQASPAPLFAYFPLLSRIAIAYCHASVCAPWLAHTISAVRLCIINIYYSHE